MDPDVGRPTALVEEPLPNRSKDTFVAVKALKGSGLRIYLALTRITAAVFGVLQLSVIARMLPADQFALVAGAMALAAYVQLTAEPAILGYQRLGHQDPKEDGERGEARSASQSLLLGLGVITVGIAIAWGAFVGPFGLTIAFALWTISVVQMRWASIQLLNWQRQARFGTLLMINSAARTLSMAAGAWYFRGAPQTLILGSLGSILAVMIVGPGHAPIAYGRASIKRVLEVGISLSLVAVAAASLSNWPTLVGSRLLPINTFASFIAQWNLAVAAHGATVGFVVVLGLPDAKKSWDSGHGEGANAIALRYVRYVGFGTTAILTTLWLVGNPLTSVLLGPRYAGQAILVVAVATSSVRSICSIATWRFQFKYWQRRLAVIAISVAFLQLPVVWWLSDGFGLLGLLVGVSLVNAAYAVTVIFCGRGGSRLIMTLYIAVMLAIGIGAAVVATS